MLKTIRSAIRENNILSLEYRDADEVLTTRRVKPLAIWAFTEGWLFASWCDLRQDFRAFRLDRVAAIDETGDRFEDNPSQNLQAYLATKILVADEQERKS